MRRAVLFVLVAVGCTRPTSDGWREILPPIVGEAFDVELAMRSPADSATAREDCATVDGARRSRLPQPVELALIQPPTDVWSVDLDTGAVTPWPTPTTAKALPYVCVRLH
jgi:hypothetical protein